MSNTASRNAPVSGAKNFVSLVGTLCREPSAYGEKQGHPMVLLDIRTENPVSGKLSDFHNLVVFGKLATWCRDHLKSGMQVSIHGQLAMQRWKQNGAWRTRPQVIVRTLYLAPAWGKSGRFDMHLVDPNVRLEFETDAELGF